jgi:maleylpyruvate isomerase
MPVHPGPGVDRAGDSGRWQDGAVASDDVARRLDEVRWSTEGLLAMLRDRPLTDGWARQSSLLPGWTRGHVLTHLARNADAIARTLAGAARGEKIPMYDGEAARDADIRAGADRPLQQLVEDVVGSARRLDETWSGLSDTEWLGEALTRTGPLPALRLIGMRWREVEIHRVDLADGYGPGDWPASFVAPLLPSLLDPDRIGQRLPAGLTVEVVNTDSGQRWLVGADVPQLVGTARAARVRAGAVRSAAAAPVRVVGPSWALVGWLLGRTAVVRPELGDPPALAPWS